MITRLLSLLLISMSVLVLHRLRYSPLIRDEFTSLQRWYLAVLLALPLLAWAIVLLYFGGLTLGRVNAF